MHKITSVETLREAILQLEQKQSAEGLRLKAKVLDLAENLRPVNLIRQTVKELSASDDLKEDLLVTAVGITAGYTAKWFVERNHDSILNKLLGTATQYGVTNIIANHPEMVKATGHYLLSLVSSNGDEVPESDVDPELSA